jgi:hypothetical protein
MAVLGAFFWFCFVLERLCVFLKQFADKSQQELSQR